MTTAQNTNLVTSSNIEMMKLHILGQCHTKLSSVQNLEEANKVTSMFDYESEKIETIVFAFVCKELDNRLKRKLKELGF